MSLKIIYGRGGSGKSLYMLKDMKYCDNPIYIVPEQFSFSAEKRIIAEFGMSGLGNPVVYSFRRLAEKIIEKYSGSRVVASETAREMLISHCASAISPDRMRLFDGLVRKNALAATASELITTFKRYGITERMLENAAETADDELLKRKISDSYVILKAYNEKLRNVEFEDSEDILTSAARIIEDECDFFEGVSIYIDQFSDFDPCQYELITQIMKKAQRVVVGLCMDEEKVFESVRKTKAKLERCALKNNIQIEADEEIEGAMHGCTPLIKHLEKYYFSGKDYPLSGTDGSVRMFAAKDMQSEVHDVAKGIIKLVRDKGYRYRDISVVARDAEEYKGIIDRVFPMYDIPVFLDRKIPLAGHCVALYITSVLDLLVGGFTYENVFRYVKSPFSGITNEESDSIENYCLSCGVRPYMWKKPFKGNGGIFLNEDEKSALYLEKINEIRAKIYEPIGALAQKLKNRNTVRTLCEKLFGFFEETDLKGSVRSWADNLEKNGENLCALQTVQVFNILSEIITTLCTVMGEETVSLREFATTIQAGLAAVEIGTIPSASDCVTVGSIDRIKGHGAKAVFLIGANSGKFPKICKENGIFTDADKRKLLELGIEMPPESQAIAEGEQLLIYDAFTCASEFFNVSYPISDKGGNALLCSEIIGRMNILLPDIEYSENISRQNDEEEIFSRDSAFLMLASKIRESLVNGKKLSDAASAAAYYFSRDGKFAPLLAETIKAAGYTNEAVPVDYELMQKAVGDDMRTSISRLETYNKCPFSYFAQYVLKLKPRAEFEVGASDSGSFLHNFLDLFSEAVASYKDENGNSVTWETIDDKFIKEVTAEILKKILGNINDDIFEIPRIRALFERMCRVAEKSVHTVRNHIVKSDFIPLGYEISFDDDGKFKPMKIKLADGSKVTLRGRIDRADSFELKDQSGKIRNFVRIVDYKSSDKTIDLSKVYHGIQLQLFVYLSNICENGYEPAGILYCNLSDPIVSVGMNDSLDEVRALQNAKRTMTGIVLDDEDMMAHMGGKETVGSSKTATADNFNSMFKHLKRVISVSADKIKHGEFPIKHIDGACEWCEYKSVCNAEAMPGGDCTVKFEKMSEAEIWQKTEEEN